MLYIYQRGMLVYSENTSSFPLESLLLLLLSLFEGCRGGVISPNVIEILDLVNSDDPVFTGECFLQSVQNRAFFWKSDATNTVRSLTGREKVLVVVIRHLVPDSRR